MTSKPVFELHKTLYSLSIQLGLNGFSFCIATTEGKIISSFNESSKEETYTEQELFIKILDAFDKKPELQAKFNTVEVIYHNDLFTLVPNELFDANNISTYLKYSVKTLATDYITHDLIKGTDIVTVFIPYINVNNFLLDQLGEFNYQHTSGLLIKHALKKSQNQLTEKVYTYVSKGIFEVIITKGSELLLFNSFNYANNEDLLYYLLFCMEQLSLSPNEIEVVLLSTIENELYDLIYTYVRNVRKSNTETQLLLHQLALKL